MYYTNVRTYTYVDKQTDKCIHMYVYVDLHYKHLEILIFLNAQCRGNHSVSVL